MELKIKIDLLIDQSIDFAQLCLNESREFWPFAYSIDNENNVNILEPTKNEQELEDSISLINHFKKIGLSSKLDFAITYDVVVNINNEKADAIAIFVKIINDLETENGRIYYFPYNENLEIIYEKAYLAKA